MDPLARRVVARTLKSTLVQKRYKTPGVSIPGVIAIPRHPLDGARVTIVRQDPFKRFVHVVLNEGVGEYSKGDELEFRASQVREI